MTLQELIDDQLDCIDYHISDISENVNVEYNAQLIAMHAQVIVNAVQRVQQAELERIAQFN